MNKSQKKKVRQITNGKLTSEEVQHLRRCGLTIPKSPSKRPIRRFAAWWETTAVEKSLEDIVFKLKNAALLDIINLVAGVTIIISLITWWTGRRERWEDEIFSTWQVVNDASEDKSGVTRLALERLLRNSFSLSGIDLDKTNLIRANLQEADLSLASLQQADLGKANLQEADLSGASLQQAVLRKANLQEAVLDSANLQQADLVSANLQQADLGSANLQEADLFEANLQQAFLFEANLQQADLRSANLQQALLLGASLRQADLKNANLEKADLSGASLQQADLSKVKNLTPKQIKSACNWQKAKFDKQFEAKLKKEPDQEVDCSLWSK